MKERWEEIEKKYTRNTPPKFVKYFSQHKQEKIRNSMTHYVRKRAGVYGQNPIEWQHFLWKSEINDVVKDSGQTHRNVSLPVTLDALKGWTLRSYADSVKALYREGPFLVSAEYNQFLKSYEEWKDLNKAQRMEHTKKFFTAKPRRPALTKKSQLPVAVNEFETTSSLQGRRTNSTEEDVTGTQSPPPKHLSIKFHKSSLPEECIPTAILKAIFQKAELLINEEGAIKEAASNDERLRTVKSKDGGDPLIVKPLCKKSDLFQCVCSTYRAPEICPDTVAVTNDQGVLFEYLYALRQKLSKKVSKGIAGVNLTAAIETGLRVSEKSLKQNEVRKAARRKQ